MREENMDFGQFIRSKRLKDSRELTLRDISKELGISLSMLSDIEKGRRNPFDAWLWGTLIDLMTVYSKEDIVTFKDGTEIHIG